MAAADSSGTELTATRESCGGGELKAGTDSAGAWDTDAAGAALLESIPCGVLQFDCGGELRAVSGQCAQILGWEEGELQAIGNFEMLVERLAAGFAEPIPVTARWRARREKGEACRDEIELVSPRRKTLERFARPIVDRRGRRAGWMEIYRDVTGQKLVESKLIHTGRMVALGQMVSSVAHELSNPLTTILGYAQLLLGRRESKEQQADMQRILQEAERASRIARNLLQFARGSKPERVPVDLNEVVRRALALRAYQLSLEEIEVHLELDSDLPLVLGDAAQLQQVLLNLVMNSEQAIQLDRRRGQIRLHTRRVSADRVAVSVSDDGPGIAPEALPHIFDPFFTTKPAGLGTGLGLPIAYGIANDHGGKLAVESRPGDGAVFTMELPATSGPPLAAAELTRAEPERLAAGRRTLGEGRFRSERVLVVEDEPAVARLIADVLTGEGHRTEVVLDSRDALTLIAQRGYGLVVCDLRMPYLSGRSLFRELRRRSQSPLPPFVFVTGDVHSPHIAEFLKSSGVPYLAKPFFIDELKAVVHRALNPVELPVARGESSSNRAGQKGQRSY